MSGDKTKVVAASALGVLVLGCGCYFVFAGDSGDKVQGDIGEVVSVVRTPDPPADNEPRVRDDPKRGPRRSLDKAEPRKPDRQNKKQGQGRRADRKPHKTTKKPTPPSC